MENDYFMFLYTIKPTSTEFYTYTFIFYPITLSWYNGKRRRRDALTRKSAPALNSHRDVIITDVLIHLWLC